MSRDAPVTMSAAVSSSSAFVMSAPGTRIAIGAHTANSGTGPRSSAVAVVPTIRVETNAETKGTIAAAGRIRDMYSVTTPTTAPTSRARTTAHHGQRNTTASPAEMRAAPTTPCVARPGHGRARISAMRARASSSGTRPDWSSCASRLACAAWREVSPTPPVLTVVVANGIPGRLTSTCSGSTAKASSSSGAARRRISSSEPRTSVTDSPPSSSSAPISPKVTSSSGRGDVVVLTPHLLGIGTGRVTAGTRIERFPLARVDGAILSASTARSRPEESRSWSAPRRHGPSRSMTANSTGRQPIVVSRTVSRAMGSPTS